MKEDAFSSAYTYLVMASSLLYGDSEHRPLRPVRSGLRTAVWLLPSCTTLSKSISLNNSFLIYKMGPQITHMTRLL